VAEAHTMHTAPHDRRIGPGPWFRRRPVLAVAVAALLFGAVFVVRLAVDGTTDAITLLFVLPIALLAMAFGARGGWAAGAVGVGLLAVWVTLAGADLSPLGWVSRATPMLLLGGLVGTASDRLRAIAVAEHRLLLAEARRREAAEINDAIVQRLAAAKWALEAGNTEAGVELVTESMETAEALVSDLLRGAPDRARVRRAPAAHA
jgi:hypothetical protein